MLITNPARIRIALDQITSEGDIKVAPIASAIANAVGAFGALPLGDLAREGFDALRQGDALDVFAARAVELLDQAAKASDTSLRPMLSDGTGTTGRWIWFEARPATQPAKAHADRRYVIGPTGEVLFEWIGLPITTCAVSENRDITVVGDESGMLMGVVSKTDPIPYSDTREGDPMGSAVRDIKICDDGRIALGMSEGGRVQVLDTSREVTLWMDEGWHATALAPSGEFAALAASNGKDGMARVVSGPKGLVEREVYLPGAEHIDACAISDTGSAIAIAGVFAGERKVVRTSTTQPSGLPVASYKGAAHGLAVPSERAPVVVLSNAEVRRAFSANLTKGAVRRHRLSHALVGAQARALAPDGALLMLARGGREGDGSVELWDAESEELLWSSLRQTGDSGDEIRSCSVSRLGLRLAVNSGHAVRLYDRLPVAL